MKSVKIYLVEASLPHSTVHHEFYKELPSTVEVYNRGKDATQRVPRKNWGITEIQINPTTKKIKKVDNILGYVWGDKNNNPELLIKEGKEAPEFILQILDINQDV